jgi:hypothetical protein
MIITGLRYYREGRIVVSLITLDMMETSGATENDCEDVAGIPGKAEGSMVSITIRQLEPEKCKISLRSKPQINSSDICAVSAAAGMRWLPAAQYTENRKIRCGLSWKRYLKNGRRTFERNPPD